MCVLAAEGERGRMGVCIRVFVSVCICVCVREREREGENLQEQKSLPNKVVD
jgi:hypothetical protein